ncbi:ribonuclease T2 [Amia ocellicauda]|uniref:ribonuclease T2 n=1 Tax=Amia ocellicauda TaxID=2972642 RepID=UPI003464A725
MKSLALVALLCVSHALVVASYQLSQKGQGWTHLILTHHWPQTLCSMEHVTCHGFDYWTLHGLWPDKTDMCNSSWHFNASNIEDLLPTMKKWWPDLLHSGSTKFWKHEWDKHGTCAAVLETLNSQHKYFSKALELYKKVDLDGILKKFNILPSTTYYKLDDIKGAITNFYNVKPKIQCVVPSRGEDVQTLGQIEICFDKEFQLTDCVEYSQELPHDNNEILTFDISASSGFSVCVDSMQVYYPPTETRH